MRSTVAAIALAACSGGCVKVPTTPVEVTIVTVADATRGTKASVDLGNQGDSQGDLFVFDQPLMSDKGQDVGSNGGFCVALRPREYSECQWTLTFADGTITVVGREAEKGTSRVAVSGGTGAYAGVVGELATTPTGDGKFTQVLTLRNGSRPSVPSR